MKPIANALKQEVRESKEVQAFINSIDNDLYYELSGTGKSLKGSQLKTLYNATLKGRKYITKAKKAQEKEKQRFGGYRGKSN